MPRRALIVALLASACGGGTPDAVSDRSVTAASAAMDDRVAPPRGRASAALTEDRLAPLFAADAAQTAAILQLGPVTGLLRSMRGNAVYLAAGIDLVRGTHDIRSVLEAETPDPDQTSVARTLAGGDLSADGTFGFTFGWLTRVAPNGVTYGTYVAVWERGDGEEFRTTVYYTRSTPMPHLPARPGFPLFLGGAGAGGVPHAASLDEQRRSVIETDAAFAALSVAQGSGVAFPTYANPDFLMSFGRNFVGLVGSEEINENYGVSYPGEVLDWTPVYAGAAGSGDLAYTVGNVVDAITSDGVTATNYSKYLTMWARTADGAWRFIADGGASSPPR